MKEFPPFRLDVKNKCLWRDTNSRVVLAPKAFDLLLYLVERAGNLVTQSELIDNLWPDTFVQPEVLKTQIRDVRSVLGDDARNPKFIETQHRRGYRFIAPVHDSERERKQSPEIGETRVGQEETLRKLKEIFLAACAGKPQLVLLSGEVGIGKSTVTEWFVNEVRRNGPNLRVTRGQCVDGFGNREPYYPVLQAISSLRRSPEHETIVEVLTQYAPTWLAQFPASLKPSERESLHRAIAGATDQRMLRELCDAMDAMGKDTPTLVVLEDVHWADPYTIDWLAALARGTWSAKLTVIATYRPLDVVLLKAPLKNLKDELLARNLCHEIVIPPLTKDDIQRLLEMRFSDHQIPAGLAGFLHQHSDGNPFFMESLLEYLFSAGIISVQSTGWCVRTPLSQLPVAVPGTLGKLLEIHINSGLAEDEHRVLEAASVCGVKFTATVAAVAAGVSQEGFEEICEGISQRGHFVRSLGTADLPDGSLSSMYEFTHSLYRETIYRRIPRSQRARLHSEIGHELESLYKHATAEVASELVYHFEECQEWEMVPKYLLSTARMETERFVFGDAIHSLERARELLPKLPREEAEPLLLEILFQLAACHGALEDLDQAAEALEAAEKSPVIARNPRAKAQILMRLAFARSRTDVRRSLAASNQAWELVKNDSDPFIREEMRLGALAWRSLCEGPDDETTAQCTVILKELEAGPNRLGFARCQLLYGVLLVLTSRYREGFSNMNSANSALMSDRDTYYIGADRLETYALIYAGDLGHALSKCRDGIADAVKNGNRIRGLLWNCMDAWAHCVSMDNAGALEICERCLPLLHDVSSVAAVQFAMIIRVLSETRLGKLKEATEHLQEAAAIVATQKNWMSLTVEPLLFVSEVYLALTVCSIAEARRAAQRLLSASEKTADRTCKVYALDGNARVAFEEGNLAPARTYVNRAIALMDGFDLPLAHWRIHGTAMLVFPLSAEKHRALAKATLARLADSLKDYPEVKTALLTSPQAMQIFS